MWVVLRPRGRLPASRWLLFLPGCQLVIRLALLWGSFPNRVCQRHRWTRRGQGCQPAGRGPSLSCATARWVGLHTPCRCPRSHLHPSLLPHASRRATLVLPPTADAQVCWKLRAPSWRAGPSSSSRRPLSPPPHLSMHPPLSPGKDPAPNGSSAQTERASSGLDSTGAGPCHFQGGIRYTAHVHRATEGHMN